MQGIKIATANCGIKYKNRDDLLLVIFEDFTNVAGVFTTSSMKAASVLWCQKNIASGQAAALIVNAGNANAFTGVQGVEIVDQTASAVANAVKCQKEQIFISSTGVIGEIFDYKLITNLIPNMAASVKVADEKSFNRAAKAIITTDKKEKVVFAKSSILGKEVNIVGIAKGSGMIEPNMATMLSYIFTDANISAKALESILKDAVDGSFNSITVDSDKSTNDTALLFATCKVNHELIISSSDESLEVFKKDLNDLALKLAKMIVIDGEGAKKLIEIKVFGANSKEQAKKVAKSVANSPLVKTAIAGADPNWGRIVMAVGKSCDETSPEKLIIKIGDYTLTKNGAKDPKYVEEEVHQYLKKDEIIITIDIGLEPYSKEKEAIVWTCDLNEEYIKINKDYRS